MLKFYTYIYIQKNERETANESGRKVQFFPQVMSQNEADES